MAVVNNIKEIREQLRISKYFNMMVEDVFHVED